MYIVDETADEPIMMLNKQIGRDGENPEDPYIDGAQFALELLRLDMMNKKSIQVYINCPGGNVLDGMNIYNAILKSTTPVDCHNIGIAASMGGVCFMAGRKRIMADYASLMLHNPSGGDDKAAIASLTESLATMLSAKAGVNKEDVCGLMNVESWLNAAECFEKGFCTEIAVTSDQNKKRMPSVGAVAMWREAELITNNLFNKLETIPCPECNKQIPDNTDKFGNVCCPECNKTFNKNKISNMKNVTAKLGLAEGVNEETIIAAIDKIRNDAAEEISKLTGAESTLKDELEEAKNKVTELQAKVDESEADAQRIKDEADAAAAIENETKATELVNAGVTIGKIKNDAGTIAIWKQRAIENFTDTKKMIDDLPLNRTAGVVTVIGNTGGGSADAIKSSATAAGKMIEIENRLKQKK